MVFNKSIFYSHSQPKDGDLLVWDQRSYREVDRPHSNIATFWTLMFEWCVVGCGSKNNHWKYMCSNEIGLHVQIMLPSLSPVVNIVGGGLYDHLVSMRIFTLNMIFIWTLKIVGKMTANVIRICWLSCSNCVFAYFY